MAASMKELAHSSNTDTKKHEKVFRTNAVLNMLDDSDLENGSDTEDEVSSVDSGDNECSETDDSDSSDKENSFSHENKRKAVWRKNRQFIPLDVPVLSKPDLDQSHQNWSPVDYFNQYLDGEDYEMMSNKSNIKYLQDNGRTLNSTALEMQKFFGVNILMGCYNLTRIRMYWQKTARIPVVADTITRDRFFTLRNNLKVVDNNMFDDSMKNADRLWKVRPFIEKIRSTCNSLPMYPNVCIDEQMVPFTGRCPVRQYVPRKPNPTGLKNFVLAGECGIVYDFDFYCGEQSYKNYTLYGKKAGQGVGSVLKLSERLRRGDRLFCDRFFITIPLISYLKDKGILLTGTIQNRFIPQGVKLSTDRQMKSEGRGNSEQFVHNDISIVKWYDNKGIIMASSAFGLEPQDTCMRWCRKTKTRIEVSRPAVIKAYNTCMGGVDLCDQIISYNRIGMRTRKWPVRVINHLTDLALSNSWLEFRKDNPNTKLQYCDFRLVVGQALIDDATILEDGTGSVSSDPEYNAIPIPIPSKSCRLISKHLPECVDLKNACRCRNRGCTGKSRVRCCRCGVFLCLTSSRNCFKAFHT